jgi:oxygen-independent coproporphyrinogen-3 oxidase
VAASPVRKIIGDWITKEDHGVIRHGIRLDQDEQRRRWLILSVLCADGVSIDAYLERFSRDPDHDFPELRTLEEKELATRIDGVVQLTALGFENSDVIGPWLISRRVRELMESAEIQ